ncbi:hypothetical protein GCK72_012138 [Caenorhabditis remanei]|uniref:Uncharacterized protein n=1 Tax=Caenorhabditis remanei TaxID=31234 RepID=A0A6A5GK80_CAERE|nr:hypothetical protein GCK72_012138 [Caenorhabditis remanei]KAF1755688.1 hypothetical protein GCK72_012138 [Caenorhabditis remanei]
MKILHYAAIFVIYANTVISFPPNRRFKKDYLSNKMEANYTGEIRADREDLARRSGMKSAKILKHSDDLKIPEPKCGTDPTEVFDQSEIDEMDKILKDDVDKGLEMIEKKGEETYLSCLIPTKTEVNCKVKKCDSGKTVGHCICGPKKCKMDRPTATSAQSIAEAVMGEGVFKRINEANYETAIIEGRTKMAKKTGIQANAMVRSDSLKVPEVECGRDYDEESVKMMKEVEKEHLNDMQKKYARWEEKGEDALLSCLVPWKTEVNCKFKECGNGKKNILCVCGPKKCRLDSQGFCDKSVRSEESGEKDSEKDDDESDGSASLYTFGAFVNLALFYLVASIL